MASLTPVGKRTTNAATRAKVIAADTPAFSIVVQALQANTGVVTVGDSTVVASTGVGAMAQLSAGQAVTINLERSEFNAANIYFDVATNGEGVTGYAISE
jgi:hypothetical protein